MPPNVSARIWWPKQIPNMGKFFLIKLLTISIAYFPVAAGSPGPLDKNTPFGFKLNISSAVVLQETTVTLQLKSEKYRKIFFLFHNRLQQHDKFFYYFFYNLFVFSKFYSLSINNFF